MITSNNKIQTNEYKSFGSNIFGENLVSVKPRKGRHKLDKTKILFSGSSVCIYLTENDVEYIFGNADGCKYVEVYSNGTMPIIGIRPASDKVGSFSISKYGKSFCIRMQNHSNDFNIADEVTILLSNQQQELTKRIVKPAFKEKFER